MSNTSSHTQVDDDQYDSDSDSSQSLLAHGTDYPQQSLYNGTDITPRPEPAADRARRKSFIQEDEDPLQIDIPVKKKNETVTWMSLPHKSQLAILTVARLAEPLVQTSLRVSFIPVHSVLSLMYCSPTFSINSNRLIEHCLIPRLLLKLVSCKAHLQLLNFVPRCCGGAFQIVAVENEFFSLAYPVLRYPVLDLDCLLLFWQAMCFRMLAGALNGNVGVMRTMISEIVREKK